MDEPATAILSTAGAWRRGSERVRRLPKPQSITTDQSAILSYRSDAEPPGNLDELSEGQSLSAQQAKPQSRGGEKPGAVDSHSGIRLSWRFCWLSLFWFSPTKQIESIAVMPFVNDSGNADVEYLSDGMTETLISSLSQLPNLNVKGRSSVFRYKGKGTDANAIGKELNVQAILNGRVLQHGDQLTLSLELIDAQTENVIWSEQYNRKQTDLVSLQSEIARDVSYKLKAKLMGADEQRVTKTYTANAEAYQLYLQGLYHWHKRTPDDIRKSIMLFQQATEKDPSYAQAYAGLALA